ncbi:SPFH domain-containing protein [Saxibacter everestensis]|uniref:SPFH domain-containing protein n=1 Tax=Saxibacter everestensis TaxID=2909229 RepID=A0ABY8QY68_9MICO|nr:SPFH domain-containing protein [Brevibacteriaceae bacterium ZFBP1038]
MSNPNYPGLPPNAQPYEPQYPNHAQQYPNPGPPQMGPSGQPGIAGPDRPGATPPSPTGIEPAFKPKTELREHLVSGGSGILMLILALGLLLGGVLMFFVGVGLAAIGTGAGGLVIFLSIIAIIVSLFTFKGLVSVSPGDARVLQLFGRYTGTIRNPGLRWANPFKSKRRISTRIRNHETSTLKVNDLDGNPIEIAAVVVWRVTDTAMALFEVDDFEAFVAIQAETAVRHIANTYPYDTDAESMSLRDNAEEITGKLSTEIGVRVASAGVEILESRITHLAYAPEIAQAMLQRQQATAVVAARRYIVEGAVGMVELALDRLGEREVVELDRDSKAAMVSNLMVVLCGDRGTQPVVNAGSAASR